MKTVVSCQPAPVFATNGGPGLSVVSILLLTAFLLLPITDYGLRITDSHAIDIEPMRLEYSLQAGKTYSGSFNIKNPSNSALDVFISTGDYRYVFSAGTIPPKEGRAGLPSCQDWIQFKQKKVNLTPGGYGKLDFTIKVPADANQEHLCAVIFDEKNTIQETKPKQKEANVQVQIIPRFNVPVYIAIKNSQRVSAEIQDIEVVSEERTGGIIVKITLANTGNVHIRPAGSIAVLDEKGGIVKNLPIGKCLPVFPGYKEVIPVACRKLAAGNYTAVVTIEVAKDNLIQGKTAFQHIFSKS